MKEMNEKQQGASMEDMAAANKSANEPKQGDEPKQAVVQEEAEVDMMKYLLMLWEQRRRVIKITAVFMLVGLVAALMETRIYTSTMTFAPESSNASRSGGLSSMAAFSLIMVPMLIMCSFIPILSPLHHSWQTL